MAVGAIVKAASPPTAGAGTLLPGRSFIGAPRYHPSPLQLTILGGSGFIGGRLIRRLDGGDWQIWAPDRSANLTNRHLGHVVYAIGVTGDFRSRVLDTVEAD